MKGRVRGSRTRLRLLGRRVVHAGPPAGPKAPQAPPKWLPTIARGVWHRDAAQVPGGLRGSDVTAFAHYCQVAALAEAAWDRAALALEGPAVTKGTRELLAEAAKLLRLAATLRAPFGMAPLDRQRLHLEPEEADDDLARFRRENPAP
jgi:phage terminase small subunit